MQPLRSGIGETTTRYSHYIVVLIANEINKKEMLHT